MNKKGVTTFYVTIIAGMLVILVLILLFGKLVPILKGASEAKICQYNLFVTAATKSPIINNINIPAECKMNRSTLNYGMLAKDKNKAKKDIINFNKKYKDLQFSYDPENEDDLIKYEMDKFIAKKLKLCWQTGWEGNINFFDEWWRFYEPFWEEETLPDQETLLKKFTKQFKRAPVNCLACARIKFDDELKNRFQNQNLKSINEWMQKTPIPADPNKKSYWEYTLPEKEYESIYQKNERFSYTVDKPYLIAYARVNAHRLQDAFDSIVKIFPGYGEDMKPKDISTLLLIPYEEQSEYCSSIIG